jgi:hypothetical protein
LKASNATSSATTRDDDRTAEGRSSSNTAERFTLSGPSIALDPKIHAYRNDIADIALAGQLIAPHYARAMNRTISEDTPLLESNNTASAILVEMAAGEAFAVLDITGDWAWGYRRKDHRVGYVAANQLAS